MIKPACVHTYENKNHAHLFIIVFNRNTSNWKSICSFNFSSFLSAIKHANNWGQCCDKFRAISISLIWFKRYIICFCWKGSELKFDHLILFELITLNSSTLNLFIIIFIYVWKQFWLEPFRSILLYWPALFKSQISYWQEQFW